MSEQRKAALTAESEAKGMRESARHISDDRQRLKEALSVAKVRRPAD